MVRNNQKRAKKYGITQKALKELETSQDNKCAICGSYPKTRALHIDHDHKTLKVRGLLCYRCNVGLGYIRTPVLLRKAAEYLETRG